MILLVIIQCPVLYAALATEVANGCNSKNTIVWKKLKQSPQTANGISLVEQTKFWP